MRSRPVVIGVLAAELAAGALVAAPPASAGKPEPPRPDVTPPVRNGQAEVPLPDVALSVEVELPVRSGRAGELLLVTTEPPPDAPAPSPAPPVAPAAGAPSSPAVRQAPPAPAAPAPAPAPRVAGAPPPSHTVATGDSLWEIAARHLATSTGRDRAALGAPDIAGYWVRVCETNRQRLASGDLDVIHPGEVITLPPI